MASAFNYDLTKIQLSANSAASADDDLQADINATLSDFFKTRIDDSTQAYMGKQSYGSGWFWD